MPIFSKQLVQITLLICLSMNAYSNTELYMHGNVLGSQPCIIDPSDQNIPINFSNISIKTPVAGKQLNPQSIIIHFLQCNNASANRAVTITITGTEAADPVGYLALDANSAAAGIAIGFATISGMPVLLNQASDAFPLTNGTKQIELKTYVGVSPTAIANNGVRYGNFTATAGFTLTYQ